MVQRLLAVVLAATISLSGMAVPASASHTHVVQLGDGRCVVLAANSNEKWVELPHYDDFDEDRRHPLHAKVHLGEPGTRNGEDVIWVQGSPGDVENCTSYANA